jgi:hypothetical protein
MAKRIVLLLATVGFASATCSAEDHSETLLRWHETIRPRRGEASWATIPWITDLWEARQKAAQEGKPIFVWSASGDPLGCT